MRDATNRNAHTRAHVDADGNFAHAHAHAHGRTHAHIAQTTKHRRKANTNATLNEWMRCCTVVKKRRGAEVRKWRGDVTVHAAPV